MEVENTGQHIWTFWLNTRNRAKPRKETLFVRKPGAQIHEVEQPRNPSQKEMSRAKHQDKGLS